VIILGTILLLPGATGRAVGGRRHYWYGGAGGLTMTAAKRTFSWDEASRGQHVT
jgi:Family of unknown function (DUF6131)